MGSEYLEAVPGWLGSVLAWVEPGPEMSETVEVEEAVEWRGPTLGQLAAMVAEPRWDWQEQENQLDQGEVLDEPESQLHQFVEHASDQQ